MKTLNLITALILALIIGGCATTPDFNKRKYTKGKFRIPHNLKKYKGDNKDVPVEFKALEKLQAITLDSLQNNSVSDKLILKNPSPKKEVFNSSKSLKKIPVEETNELEILSDENRGKELENPEFFTRNNEDTLRVVELTEEELDIAHTAEKQAKTGLILTIIGGILLFGIITIPLGGLIMLVGLIFSILSLVSTYNTTEGRRKAWTSVVLFILFPILAAGFILVLFLLF